MEELKRKNRNDTLKKTVMKIAAASVTVVTVVAVTLKHLTVTAFDLNMVGNTLYYSITVDAIGEGDTNSPSKVVLSSQFGEIESSLEVGFNEGKFENLQPNTNYEVLVQEFNGTLWVTLEKKSIETKRTSNAVIETVTCEGDLLSPYRNLQVSLNAYIIDDAQYYLAILDSDQYAIPLSNDIQVVTIENMAYQPEVTVVIKNALDDTILSQYTLSMIPYIAGNIELYIEDNIVVNNQYTLEDSVSYIIRLYDTFGTLTELNLDSTLALSKDIYGNMDMHIYAQYGALETELFQMDLSRLQSLEWFYSVIELENAYLHQVYVLNPPIELRGVSLNGIALSLTEDSTNYEVYTLINSDIPNTITFIFNETNEIQYILHFEVNTNE